MGTSIISLPPNASIVPSSSCGVFTTASSTFVNITNLSVSLVTSGRPIFVGLVSDQSGNNSFIGATSSSASLDAAFVVSALGVLFAQYDLFLTVTGATALEHHVPSSSLFAIVTLPAASYTFNAQCKLITGALALASYSKLIAFEMK